MESIPSRRYEKHTDPRYEKHTTEVDCIEVDKKEVEETQMPDQQIRQKGKYQKGEFSHLNNPNKIYSKFVEVWRDTVGAGSVCKKPFKNGWDWFVDICEAADADTLVPAFELWAQENASVSQDQPVSAFLGVLTDYTQRLAEPKAGAGTEDLQLKLDYEASVKRDIAEAKERNVIPEQKGESVEDLFARVASLGAPVEN